MQAHHALRDGERAIFGGIGRQFMEQQRQRRRRPVVDRDIVTRQDDARHAFAAIGRENLIQHALEQPFPIADLRRRFDAVRADEIMGAAERQDAVAQVVRDVGDRRMLARRQTDEAGNHGEDILDPMRQFVRDHLPLVDHHLLFVNVGAGADPADDDAIGIADRQGAAQRPAIIAAMMAQPIFDFIRLAGRQAVAPASPGPVLIVGMEHAAPAGAVGRSGRDAGIVVPAGIIIIMIAVRQRRPDHLRHGVGERAEHPIAFGDGGRVHPLAHDHVAVAAAPLQFHHHLPGEQRQPLPLQWGQPVPRHRVDDAQRTQRLTIGADERRTCIEADMRRTGDEGVVGETGIAGRIGHGEDIVAQHRQRAKGYVARRFFRIQSDARQEALAHILYDADQRDRRVAQRRRKAGYLVQSAEAAGIQIVKRQQCRAIRRQAAPISHYGLQPSLTRSISAPTAESFSSSRS